MAPAESLCFHAVCLSAMLFPHNISRILGCIFSKLLSLVRLGTKMNWLGFGVQRLTELNTVHRLLTIEFMNVLTSDLQLYYLRHLARYWGRHHLRVGLSVHPAATACCNAALVSAAKISSSERSCLRDFQ